MAVNAQDDDTVQGLVLERVIRAFCAIGGVAVLGTCSSPGE
jgi:hypothetical protein